MVSPVGLWFRKGYHNRSSRRQGRAKQISPAALCIGENIIRPGIGQRDRPVIDIEFEGLPGDHSWVFYGEFEVEMSTLIGIRERKSEICQWSRGRFGREDRQ